jgi:chromosome segregation ATPase
LKAAETFSLEERPMWLPLIALIVSLAVAVVLIDQTLQPNWDQAPGAFMSLSHPQQAMVAAVALMALYLMVAVVWQSARAKRNSRALALVANRRENLVDATVRVDETQRNLNAAVEHMVATDPDNALLSLHQRVTKAELLTATHRSRSGAADLDQRLAEIRRRQQTLREQLGEVTEARRTVAPVFDELRERQIQLDRALTQMEQESDAAGRSVADRLKTLTDNVIQSQTRLKALEDSAETLNRYKEDFGNAVTRIAPLQAAEGGVWSMIAELNVRQRELSKTLDAIDIRDGEKLSVRADSLARNKRDIEQRMTQLVESASLLDSIRTAFHELAERAERLGRSLAEIETDPDGHSLVDRQNELNQFVEQSRGRLGALEHTLGLLNRFKEELDKYQRELTPLQSPTAGIEAAISDLHGRRDRLDLSLQELEEANGERLSGRVEAIHRNKTETEQRIAEAVGHFSRLDALRKDVDGLFGKLRQTIDKLG